VCVGGEAAHLQADGLPIVVLLPRHGVGKHVLGRDLEVLRHGQRHLPEVGVQREAQGTGGRA